ncbi:MAG TPA: DUF1800 domain-containing protein [Solirubrobacteraceae bacterium]|nr:DUF1800 domain-containing protein [Solirubrobacteraceae bacterium]
MKLATRKKKRTPSKRCRVVRDKRTGRKRKVCRKPVRRPAAAPVPQPLPRLPVPSAAAPPATAPPARSLHQIKSPIGVYQGAFGRRQAERLLWRAGFGPRPGDADRLAALGLRGAVESLTRPQGQATLTGPEPRDADGNPIDPLNVWGHDHVWWLDRMVRGDQPLVERMALIWHDWFATSQSDVGDAPMMLAQNALFRTHGLGSFHTLALEVTRDPAMLVFLNGIDNRRGRPNENYARELMELFTLGADRGAYTETDVRELARALTGWRADWSDAEGRLVDFRFEPYRHDTGTKSLWAGTAHARSGTFGWEDAVRLCLEHPMHAEFFVRKLWSYFVPTPPPDGTRAQLEQLYVSSGFQIRPVVEAILTHPDLYAPSAPLVKPPVVYAAGLLRLRGRAIETDSWAWLGSLSGQQLFHPPNVSGWNDNGWLDTSTVRGRWLLGYYVLRPEYVRGSGYSATETAAEAVDEALAFWDRPSLTAETVAELLRFAEASIPPGLPSWEQSHLRAYRMNALRHLVAASPDFQTS